MQNAIQIVDDGGTTLATLTADTEMRGVALEFFATWHTPELLDQYVAAMNTQAQWLRDNATPT